MKPTTPAGIMKTVENSPVDFEPGAGWHYDNSGYELLGMIIEKLDGRKYSESLRVRILQPLGMNQTYFTSERSLVKHRAQGYEPDGKGGFKHAPYLNMDWPYAAGSMESTTLDLAKWDAALYGDKILPQNSLKQMWTPTTLSTGKKEDYGFGWQVSKLNGVDLVEHGGGIHGFTTFIRRAPSKGLTVIVLLNDGDGDTQKVAADVMGIVDSSLKVEPPKTVPDKDKAATDYARATLQAMIDGKLDRSKLTPEFSKQISPAMEQGAQKLLAGMGKINGFELLSDKMESGVRTRSYRATLGTTTLTVVMVIDAKGLISGLAMRP